MAQSHIGASLNRTQTRRVIYRWVVGTSSSSPTNIIKNKPYMYM